MAAAASKPAGSVPLLDLEARRLILVAPADAEEASAAGANHVVTHHGDEVRYLITSPTPAGLRQSELISEGMQPLVVGGLGIERSTFLSLGKSEAEMEDALAIRDFVLRGTRPGSASVIVGDGHAHIRMLNCELQQQPNHKPLVVDALANANPTPQMRLRR